MENIQNFNQKEVIKKLTEIADKKTKILLYFIEIKKYNFENYEQIKSIFKLYKNSARNLEVYSLEKIKKTMEWLRENSDFKWTVCTVLKYIDEPLEELKAGGKKITEDDFIKSLKQQNYGKT